jgi:hypothetical protein
VDWPGKVVLGQLVLHACGLFIWAATACRFIRKGKRFARKRLDTILKGSSNTITALDKHLNEIYLTVLKHSISSEYSDEEIKEVCDILKHTLVSRPEWAVGIIWGVYWYNVRNDGALKAGK